MNSFPSGPKGVDPLVGRVLAERFELRALAGVGGMGRVYRAIDRRSGDAVALKVLPGDGGDAARFAREAEVLASLDHPGVVRHVAHGTTSEGWQYLAMEWLVGEDLAHRLELGTLGIEETLVLAKRVSEALSAAHAHGIVHRDLKPGNLFLVGGRLDEVKLLDFGIARMLDGGELTVSGTVIGTPQYMSPEQVRGAPVDARADVYGLGAVIFRCLAGHPPFAGTHQIAVLAKIVLETPARLRDLRDEVPPQLDALLERMLAKDPDQRPRDGADLRRELGSIDASPSAMPLQTPAVVTASERRVACVVLCARSVDDETTRPETLQSPAEDALVRTIRDRGGVVDALARGAWVVTIPGTASLQEQALRAVRCAMALSSLRPRSPVYVATGRVLVDARQTVGEVIDRAADAMVQTAGRPTGVWIDASTAELVEGRFLVESRKDWVNVLDEVDAVVPVRTLLGKPTPCVGREPQVAMLGAMLQSVGEQRRASSAVLTAPAGMGKTHLVHEFLRSGLAAASDVDLIVARGDVARTASPLGLLGQLLRRAAGIADSDDDRARSHKLAALLGRDLPLPEQSAPREMIRELCGLPVVDEETGAALRAARADPSVMADAVREAWTEWLGGRAARGTTLLLVEDAHWADAPSLALIEHAVVTHAELPVFLLATARPGTVKWERLRAGGLVEITLAPLSAAASERLARSALGSTAGDEAVRRLVARAGGHPFHLEELIRAVAAGRGTEALPDSVLGMVQARFDRLDARARRTLRAASVFGETFWSGGVGTLLGDEVSAHELQGVLGTLVDGEIIGRQRTSRWAGQTEYRFRHGLLRDGAYASLADDDRVRAHRRAAVWLEETGETEPAVLADHYDRGAAPHRALEFLCTAAQQALHRNDLAGAMAHATRARGLGPDVPTEAALSAVEAEVQYWRGDLEKASSRAADATRELNRGTREWFDAVAIDIAARGQLGRNEQVAPLLEDAAALTSTLEGRGAQVVALARGMVQLFWAHYGGGLPTLRARFDELVDGAGALDPHHAAWVHRLRGESAWLHAHDVGRCLDELATSCEHFERAHALRGACLTRLNAASLRGWSGAPEAGLELVARSLAEATKLGADYLVRYGRAVEGLLLAYAGRPEAESTMREALPRVSASPRLSFLCHVVVGWLALERGDVDEASKCADAARAVSVAPELSPAGVALAARVLTARKLHTEAIALVRDAATREAMLPDLELTWGMAGVALAEASSEVDALAARDALGPVLRRLTSVAGTLPSDEARARFWCRPLPNARAQRLASTLGLM